MLSRQWGGGGGSEGKEKESRGAVELSKENDLPCGSSASSSSSGSDVGRWKGAEAPATLRGSVSGSRKIM